MNANMNKARESAGHAQMMMNKREFNKAAQAYDHAARMAAAAAEYEFMRAMHHAGGFAQKLRDELK